MPPTELDQAERAVLDLLLKSNKPYPPRDLIDRLGAQTGLSDGLVREVIWRLIDRKEIELTTDRKLAPVETH